MLIISVRKQKAAYTQEGGGGWGGGIVLKTDAEV